MILVSLTNGMLFALGCIPPQALWDPKYYMLRLTGKLQCINTRAAGFFGLGSSLAFDLAVTCFPLLYIHKMQLESHHKWWLSCFFSLGFL